MKTQLSAFFLILFVWHSVSAQSLDANEKTIVTLVDSNIERAISFLGQTVDIESPTENMEGQRAMGELYKREFEAIGFKVRFVDMSSIKRGPHFVAEKMGKKGKRILLLGHTDTVLFGEKFRRDGDKAYGTGIGDMKGGNVVILYALKALASAEALKDTTITVMLTSDEESSSDPVVSRREMIELAKKHDIVLSFENGSHNNATVARRGSSSWELEVTAKTGHSGQIFKESMGSGAIFEASRIVDEFYRTLKGEKYLTFNPGLFVGGTDAEVIGFKGNASGKTNVVAARAIVRGDLRTISKEQLASARARMTEIVSRSLPGTSAKIRFSDGIPAMSPTDANYALLKQLDQVSRDLGYGSVEALDPGDRGAGDVSYVAEYLTGLDGLGGIGGGAHAKGESMDLSALPKQIKRTAVLIYRLTK